MRIQVHVPRPTAIGAVRLEGVRPDVPVPELEARLQRLLDRLQSEPLPEELEARRQAVRTLLRNGRYKPTGRAKPASEYLLREAQQGRFPRINTLVDAANYVSLAYMLPISLWDVDRAGSEEYRFRLGRPGERYVFNTSGQVLELEDLLIGCALRDEGERPIISPVKDALETKTSGQTRRVGVAVYAPPEACSIVEALLQELVELLERTGPEVRLRAFLWQESRGEEG
jgi:DNA/RNA-binding domain of Phe-tRNA-synthetase-like protein|nr:MAG: hypothetical protein KatS3mg041_1228 [Bacteroidota bacterium]